jgi:hypothetical protein
MNSLVLLAIANGSVPDADPLTQVNYDPPTSRVRAFSFTTSSGKWLERRGRVSVSLGVTDDLRNEMTAVGVSEGESVAESQEIK